MLTVLYDPLYDCRLASETMTKNSVVMTTARDWRGVLFQAISQAYNAVSKQTRYVAFSYE